MPDDFEQTGRAWHRNALDAQDLALLDAACRTDRRPGVRLGWTHEVAAVLRPEGALSRLAQSHLPGASPVRILAFNKSAKSNWGVPWHQDRVVALKARCETPGYSCWVGQVDFWHAEPPLALLEKMVFARVFLDDSDEANGAMEFALGSHKWGRVVAGEAARIAADSEIEIESARRGDVLFLKGLTLHRSGRAAKAAQRRIVRIDFAVREALDEGLKWALPQN